MEFERLKLSEYKEYVAEIGAALKNRQYGYCKKLQQDLLSLLKADDRNIKRRYEEKCKN